MHTLFYYHCLFHPISMLLHTLNSTLYFVLFRIFNSVITTVIHCSLPVRRLTYEVFQLVTQRTAWLRTWMGNELLLSTSSSKDRFVSQSSTLQSGAKGEWRVKKITVILHVCCQGSSQGLKSLQSTALHIIEAFIRQVYMTFCILSLNIEWMRSSTK